LLAVFAASCTKDPSPLFSNSVIKGNAALWGEWINDPAVNVIAKGPYGKVSALSEPGGGFVLSGLGNGTYSLEYVKEGYGTIKKYNIQLFGNDTIDLGFNYIFRKYNNFELPELDSIKCVRIPVPTGIIETNKAYSGGGLPMMPVIVYLGADKNVSYKNYSYIRAIIPGAGDKIELSFDLQTVKFKSGTEVFLIAYAGNPEEVLNGYLDTFSGLPQISTLIPEKHSQVMSFIMP
jgi:hypothetical protein